MAEPGVSAAHGLCAELYHDRRQSDGRTVSAVFDALPVSVSGVSEPEPDSLTGKPGSFCLGRLLLRFGIRCNGHDSRHQRGTHWGDSPDCGVQSACLEALSQSFCQRRYVSPWHSTGGASGCCLVCCQRHPGRNAQSGIFVRFPVFRRVRTAGQPAFNGTGPAVSCAAAAPGSAAGCVPAAGLEAVAVLCGFRRYGAGGSTDG